MSDKLLELADRCEKAEGADIDLDLAISEATKAWKTQATWRQFRPTASIDAAMTLVPEGWLLQLSDWQHEALRARGPWQALLNPDRDSFEHTFKARCDNAATPALALCAAALRARASKEQSK